MRSGRTPMYPNYFESSYPERNLAVLDGDYLHVQEVGDYTVHSYKGLVELLFHTDALTFIQSLADRESFPFLRDAIADDRAEVMSSKEGKPIAIRIIRGRNRSRWIVPANMWERAIDETFLTEMRSFYNYFKMVKPTPGSMGQALLRQSFSRNHLPKHTAPNAIAYDFLTTKGHGGRCDVFR